MRAEIQLCFPVVQSEEGARIFCQASRAGSSFIPMVGSLATQASSICFKTRHLLAAVEGLAILQVDGYRSHQTPLNGEGRSHFDVQLCTGVCESALFLS